MTSVYQLVTVPDPVRERTIRTGLCIFTANSLSRFPRLCIWTTATSSQLDSLPLVSAVPCATDAMLHIQDHTACQWWCWNSNLNLSYLRNKSTRKEKGLKLIFTTVFPMWTTTLSPFSCCFLTIINPRQTDQWHSLEWHTLSFLYTSALAVCSSGLSSPLPCPAEHCNQNWALWAQCHGSPHPMIWIWFFLVLHCC